MRRFAYLVLVSFTVAACATGSEGRVTPELKAALQTRAGAYPLKEVVLYGRDSAEVFFEDSLLTRDALEAETWMFGPPVTAEEAGACPPEKVLGQRIARELWWRLGADTTLQQIVVRVKATKMDQLAEIGMYYYLEQVRDPWVGDTLGRR